MAWTIRTLRDTSKEVVLQINSAKADDSTSLDIPWTYVDKLLGVRDGGRYPTKDDIYISDIMGYSGYHDIASGKGSATVDFKIDVTCPTTGIGEAGNENSIVCILSQSKNINTTRGRKRFNSKGPKRFKSKGSISSLNRDKLSAASKATHTHDTTNMLSLNVSSGSIVSGSSSGLSYIINFKCKG